MLKVTISIYDSQLTRGATIVQKKLANYDAAAALGGIRVCFSVLPFFCFCVTTGNPTLVAPSPIYCHPMYTRFLSRMLFMWHMISARPFWLLIYECGTLQSPCASGFAIIRSDHADLFTLVFLLEQSVMTYSKPSSSLTALGATVFFLRVFFFDVMSASI